MPVPLDLRSKGLGKRQREMGNGAGYLYPHEFEGAFIRQDYGAAFGEFYRPTDIGHEAKIKRRLEFWWSAEPKPE